MNNEPRSHRLSSLSPVRRVVKRNGDQKFYVEGTTPEISSQLIICASSPVLSCPPFLSFSPFPPLQIARPLSVPSSQS